MVLGAFSLFLLGVAPSSSSLGFYPHHMCRKFVLWGPTLRTSAEDLLCTMKLGVFVGLIAVGR